MSQAAKDNESAKQENHEQYSIKKGIGFGAWGALSGLLP